MWLQGGCIEAESGGAGSRSAVATPSSPLEGGRTGAAVGGEGCRRLLNTDTDDYADADAVSERVRDSMRGGGQRARETTLVTQSV